MSVKSPLATAERFHQQNVDAAKLIVGAADCYDGLPLLWARRVLARENPSFGIRQMPEITERTIEPGLTFQAKLNFSSGNYQSEVVAE